MPIDTSGFDVRMNEFKDHLRDREEFPIDWSWMQSEGQEYLDHQFDVEGVDERGGEDAFQENDIAYDMWKAATGKSTEKMQKDGRLKDAVANSHFTTESDMGVVNYIWSWSVWNEKGENYAYTWQHDNAGDSTGDRKLRFDKPWVREVARKWAEMERKRIEEIWS